MSPRPSAHVVLTLGGLSSLVGIAAYKLPYSRLMLTTVGGALLTSITIIYYLAQSRKKRNKTALNATEWRDFPVLKISKVSHNTSIYRLKLQSPQKELGLNIGQHVSVKAMINDKLVQRSYTPVSLNNQLGYVDLLIKSYPQGNLSNWFSKLKVGDLVSMKGPKGAFIYKPNMVETMGMIAGGTGLTPMLQVIKAILLNPLDKTIIKFIFANVNFDDILLKDELDALTSTYPSQFFIHYVLNNPPEGWTGGVGFVTKDVIAQFIPAPDSNVKILLCGPPPMIKAMTQNTLELGFEAAQTISKPNDQVFKF